LIRKIRIRKRAHGPRHANRYRVTMASTVPSPLLPRAVVRSSSLRASDLALLLERALDRVDQAFHKGAGEAHAAAALRGALLGATGSTTGAARLAGQMELWYRETPDRARALSRAALAETIASLIRQSALV
jgi:hypothetical protein